LTLVGHYVPPTLFRRIACFVFFFLVLTSVFGATFTFETFAFADAGFLALFLVLLFTLLLVLVLVVLLVLVLLLLLLANLLGVLAGAPPLNNAVRASTTDSFFLKGAATPPTVTDKFGIFLRMTCIV
jgi:hypothetical protein